MPTPAPVVTRNRTRYLPYTWFSDRPSETPADTQRSPYLRSR